MSSHDEDRQSQAEGEDTGRRLNDNDNCGGDRGPIIQQRPQVSLEDRLAETARIVQQMAAALTER